MNSSEFNNGSCGSSYLMPPQTDSYKKYNSNEYTSINNTKSYDRINRSSKVLYEQQECPIWKEGELMETGGVSLRSSELEFPPAPASPIRLIDKLMISVGMLFRIQTVVIFVVLLFVEYDNDCRVPKGSMQPLKYETLIDGSSSGLTNIRDIQRLFNFILLAIFLTSLLSSILYIKKTLLYIKIKKNPNSQKTLYKLTKNQYRKAQILQIAVMCGTQITFSSNETQVCSGWYIGFTPFEVVSKILQI